jgi:two-component system, cell cycle sensor histidine kinase and response regulator CckA
MGSPTPVICISSETGRYVFVNQAFADLVGRPLAEVMKSDPYEVWIAISSPEEFERQRREAGRVATGELERFQMDLHVKPASGESRPVRATVVGSRDERGRLAYITVYYADLTEQLAAESARDRAESLLQQAQKLDALGKLAGGVAHDFNNRLLVIIGYGELVKSQLPADDPLIEDVDMILSSANGAAELSRQLLAYCRRQVLMPSSFDLNLAVGNTRRMFERLVGDTIEVTTKLGAKRFVFSDQAQIEQVILNLAINARDAMPGGGRLTLETADVTIAASHGDGPPALSGSRGAPAALAPGDYVKLVVADTGTGIADDVAPHIFEPFFTTKGPGKGTGLGLSMVEGIVRQSRGAIDIATRVGEGTRVSVYLPCAASVAEEPVLSFDELTSYAPGLETVLVCDDDEAVRRLVVDVIGLRAYRILQASNGQQAIDLAARHNGRIDLLVTDVVMPGMGGVELAAELRKRDPDLRVLYLSGYIDRLELLSSSLNHRTRFMAKPFVPARLIQMLSAFFEHPRNEDEERAVPRERGARREIPGAGLRPAIPRT